MKNVFYGVMLTIIALALSVIAISTGLNMIKNAQKQDVAQNADEPKAKDVNADEPKAKDVNADEPKAKDVKADEPKAKDVKADEPKAKDAKADEPKAKDAKADKPKAKDAKADKPKAKDADAAPELKGTWTVEGKMPGRQVGKKIVRDNLEGTINFTGKSFAVRWNDGEDRDLTGTVTFAKDGEALEIAFKPTGGVSARWFERNTSASLKWDGTKYTGTWYREDGGVGGDYSISPPKAAAPEPKKK